MFTGDIKRDQWHEMGYRILSFYFAMASSFSKNLALCLENIL